MPSSDPGVLFQEAVSIMKRLRGPDGCPWDREQTPESIRPYTLEETYEVLDAIERKHPADLCEELGDLLLQVLFYAQMASEAGEFTIADVVAGLNRKLLRRHPHVFGAEAAAAAGNRAELAETDGIGAAQVLANWNAIKQMEKAKPEGEPPVSRLSGVSRAQPALLEAQKLGSAAAKAGFDWPDADGILAKVREETAEVEAELPPTPGTTDALRLELGDLLFSVVNLARHLHVDAETALRDANTKFRRRFSTMERAGGAPLEERSLVDLELLWQAAKQTEQPA